MKNILLVDIDLKRGLVSKEQLMKAGDFEVLVANDYMSAVLEGKERGVDLLLCGAYYVSELSGMNLALEMENLFDCEVFVFADGTKVNDSGKYAMLDSADELKKYLDPSGVGEIRR